MNDQTEQLEELTDALEVEVEEEVETDEQSEPDQEEAQADTDAEAEGETVVTFGDDTDPEPKEAAPAWVKDVRKENRRLQKELKEAQKQITAGKADEETALGAEPTLEDCDYDADKYRDALRQWDHAKAKQDAKANEAKEAERKQQEAYNARLNEYQEGKQAFNADEFDEAEDAVKSALNDNQQTILVHAFGGKAAPLIQGLGQNDRRLKELASITDPIAFAVAATRLESSMKTTRKPRTVPEARPTGNSAGGASGDKHLEKLREAAAKSGDYSQVTAYKRKIKAG